MSYQTDDLKLPPDPYEDVYAEALCKGLMGDFHVSLCDGCPVKDRCDAMYSALQFGSLGRQQGTYENGEPRGTMIAALTGTWGGHVYSQNGAAYMRDGVRYLVKDRPEAPSWATK